ncbi:MAG TPA: FAD-dependent oxidoreductase, partial [Alphaproteobacteria bacterium]|nr:FAD-dependent oxidoreductase [Alphaproteobacteria bacterium]
MRSINDQSCDLLVVGGGLVGLALARAAAHAGLDVLIVDREAPKQAVSNVFDGRVSSIARGSANMLNHLGVWDLIREDAQPIKEIRVTDDGSPFFLHYASRDVGNGPMGYILENRILRRALQAAVEQDPRIAWRTQIEVEEIECGIYGVCAQL